MTTIIKKALPSGYERYFEYLLKLRDENERYGTEKDKYLIQTAIDYYVNLPGWYAYKWLAGRTSNKEDLEDF